MLISSYSTGSDRAEELGGMQALREVHPTQPLFDPGAKASRCKTFSEHQKDPFLQLVDWFREGLSNKPGDHPCNYRVNKALMASCMIHKHESEGGGVLVTFIVESTTKECKIDTMAICHAITSLRLEIGQAAKRGGQLSVSHGI